MGVPIKLQSDPETLSSKLHTIIHSTLFKNLLLALVIIILLYVYGFFKTTKRHPPGITVVESPVQEVINDVKAFDKEGFTIRPLFKYTIKGKVLAFGNFFFTSLPKLSPFDITLGWRELSNQEIIDQIKFTHMPRYVMWVYPEGFNLDHERVNSQVSNNHIIPANDLVKKTLDSVRIGDILSLSGYLVHVSKDNQTWSSSTTRYDQGDGACEVMWVESAEIKN